MQRAPLFDLQLLNQPVSYAPLESETDQAGAECVFLGRTRAETHPQHGKLVRLAYECHRPLAERTLNELAITASERWSCLCIRIYHALGDVPAGGASVLIQVLCPHRAEAFSACRYLIDELKSRVPIWKREEWESGSTWVTGQPVPQAMHGEAI